jgi:hypothetical protein
MLCAQSVELFFDYKLVVRIVTILFTGVKY